MQTLRLNGDQAADLTTAATMIRAGMIVAFPTETVYGLAADATNSAAVTRIFSAKNRPNSSPLIVHVHNLASAWRLWDLSSCPNQELVKMRIEALAAAFWPGPLTIVCEKSALVSLAITGGSSKVAVRIPVAAIARQLIKQAGAPIVAPSANAHQRPSPTTAEHVLLTLDGKIDAVLDGGTCTFGIESTVVDVSAPIPLILRSGAISYEQLIEIIPELRFNGKEKIQTASPGQLAKHYSPHLPRTYLCDRRELKAAWLSSHSLIASRASATQLTLEFGLRRSGFTHLMPDDAVGFASELYAAFYLAELHHTEPLAIERPPDEPEWASVLDKMTRAAHQG